MNNRSKHRFFLFGAYLCALYYLLPFRPAYLVYQHQHAEQWQVLVSNAVKSKSHGDQISGVQIHGDRFPKKDPNRFDFIFFPPHQQQIPSSSFKALPYQIDELTQKSLLSSKTFLSFRGPPQGFTNCTS